MTSLGIALAGTGCSGGHSNRTASTAPVDSSTPGPGGPPTSSASTGPHTALGRTTRLFEPIKRDQVPYARAHIEHLPGVVSVVYLWQRHQLRVVLSPDITMSQRNRVVQAVARALSS